MKVALVHDWLNTKFGGAEKVLLELAELFPTAPIYTLIYNPETCGDLIKPERVRTSSLQKMPGALKERPRYLLPLIPSAIEQFDLTGYDVVISSSSAFAKAVITRPETLHVCYCHAPMRFVWDYWPRYVAEQRVGPLRRAAIHTLTSRLRVWDYYSAARVDRWIANSNTTAVRISKYYHQKADAIVYPGTDLSKFKSSASKKDYYITLGMLTPYKKIDVAIEACNNLRKQLIVIGDGADRARLERLAGPTVEFAGFVGEDQKARLLAEAKALIFPGVEDFGIAPVEAMASGTPVIALGEGGATETVKDGVTGVLFNEQSVEGLSKAIDRFESTDFNQAEIAGQASAFDVRKFRTAIMSNVEKWYAEYVKTNGR